MNSLKQRNYKSSETPPNNGIDVAVSRPLRGSSSGEVHTVRTSVPVREDRRKLRWDLRNGLQKITTIPRVRRCGKVPVATGRLVELRQGVNGSSSAGFAGLQHCGSVWLCPCCSAQISRFRAEELTKIAGYATSEKKCYVSMLTLTQRHNKKDSLKDLLDGLQSGWRSITTGRRWVEFRKQLGIEGYCRSVEITFSEKFGWHAHVHCLFFSHKNPETTPFVFFSKRPKKTEIVLPRDFVADRWEAGISKVGLTFLREKGMDWSVCKPGEELAMSRYVAKMQSSEKIAKEATLGQFKQAKRGNRTPFQLLADAVEGDLDALSAWREYEGATWNRRQITYSRGLRDWANMLEPELSDAEIVQSDKGGFMVASFASKDWKKVVAAGRYELLLVLERHGHARAFKWLDERGIFYIPGNDPPPPEEVTRGENDVGNK